MRASTSEWENLFSAVENFKGGIKREQDNTRARMEKSEKFTDRKMGVK